MIEIQNSEVIKNPTLLHIGERSYPITGRCNPLLNDFLKNGLDNRLPFLDTWDTRYTSVSELRSFFKRHKIPLRISGGKPARGWKLEATS